MFRTGSLPRRAGAAITIAVVLLACGCAYFNTFYNAKSSFNHAESDRTKGVGSLGIDNYQKCIDKCQLLMRYYSKSKYIDDALYLMGMSRLYRGEYVQSRAAFEELSQRFPKSEYVERGYYYMGLAALEQGDAAGAAQAFEQLSTKYPDSKLAVEAVFRTAEAQLKARDYELARAQLRAFMHDHPKSPLASEAQLRLARTYYDERRYEEARTEYGHALEMKITPEVRYEAQLNSALSQRAMAEEVLSNPALERTRRARAGALRQDRRKPRTRPVEQRPQPPDGSELPAGEAPPGTQLPVGDPRREEMAQGIESMADSASERNPDAPEGSDVLPGSAPTMPRNSRGRRGAPKNVAALVDSQSIAALADTFAIASMSAEDQGLLAKAESELQVVEGQLVDLRKPAARLGRQVELDIELAVTRALRGAPDDAMDDLDQIARSEPRTETAARARYEIGEIHRRLGEFDKARQSYDDAITEKQDATIAVSARSKSGAIVSRAQASEKLKDAPRTLQRWKELQAEAATVTTDSAAAADSLGESIRVQADFEDLAGQQLRVAEIDLLELDQPLAALREFELVLEQYPGSLQNPRAAFGIAWIYHHRLRNPVRAKQAYEAVVRDHAETPQGREARDILANWTGSAEVMPPSSRP